MNVKEHHLRALRKTELRRSPVFRPDWVEYEDPFKGRHPLNTVRTVDNRIVLQVGEQGGGQTRVTVPIPLQCPCRGCAIYWADLRLRKRRKPRDGIVDCRIS